VRSQRLVVGSALCVRVGLLWSGSFECCTTLPLRVDPSIVSCTNNLVSTLPHAFLSDFCVL
jgi:hypothetical protein